MVLGGLPSLTLCPKRIRGRARGRHDGGGIDPTDVYGRCFDEPSGMRDRRIVFTFAKGTSSNIQDGESVDEEGKRMKKISCECIVKEVRDNDVMVAWEDNGVPEEEWPLEPLQLHTLEIGTEWKLLTTTTRGGFLRGLKVLDSTERASKRQRTTRVVNA